MTRLFQQFQPNKYELELEPDAATMKFNGRVTISGKKIGRPSKRLTFHQKDLKITDAKVIKHDKNGDLEIPIARINKQASYNEVRLHSDSLLYPGEYTITLKFGGEITPAMHGIYPCFYKHKGQDKKLVATQFESHHAREAFPCVDEPEAKATFDLTLIVPEGETALANTPIKKRTTKSGKQVTIFETSPKMSTYLLAFVTGELHSVSSKTKDGIVVSSWATVAQPTSHLSYANDEAVKVLEFFSDYFKTPFPLKKLDQVALPDFESLAMENWGLITFREVGLLADPVNRSISGEQLITLVISHEISHQWFGNLVTMRWWDDLWLNESFASIMENIAPDKLHPDWHQWEDFSTGRVISCSHRDIYKDVQPVGVEVKHPDEIMTLFDPAIVYAKGARLLNMLLDYIGEDAFRSGLQSYFKKYAYTNTSRSDLWKEFSLASKQDIDKLMTPWIQQSGMPLVKVKRHDNKLSLSQKRFLMDGDDTTSIWPIPLLADKKLEPPILSTRTTEITYSDPDMPILNINGNGHFVVSYEDSAAQDRLRSSIVKRSVESIGRINIINDMLLLSRAGQYPLSSLLELISECSSEPRDAVWSIFMRTIAQAQVLTDEDEGTEKYMRAYKYKLSNYWYSKLGWTDKANDDPNTKHLRATALSLSIAGENPEAIKHALDAFSKAGSVEKLPAEQRAMIAGVAVRFGKKSYIKQLMDEYTSSLNPDVQQSITLALCSTKDVEVAKQLLRWGMSENGAVRQQDIDHWFAYLMRNYRTRALAWDWLVSNWNRLAELFMGGKHMEYFIWYSSGSLSTPKWQKKFQKFFEPKINEPALKRNIQIALSEIDARVAWRARDEAELKKYLKQA